MNGFLEKLFDKIPWGRIWDQLFSILENQKIAGISSLILLTLAIIFGCKYWERSSAYESIVRDTLTLEAEATPQRFKGLESFLLSNVEKNVDEDLKGMSLSPDFIKTFESLQKQLDEIEEKSINTTKIKLRKAEGDNGGKIYTDAEDGIPGFLYLPTYLLRQPLEDEQVQVEQKSVRTTLEKFKKNPLLLRDVAVTRALAKKMQEFTHLSVVKTEDHGNPQQSSLLSAMPAQVYLITKNGINRIFSNQINKPEKYYGSQFPATIFFPSRPYFWPAYLGKGLEENLGEKPLSNYFYVSRPYMDLGGNGIVVTLSRRLKFKNAVQGVVCFDLPFMQKDIIQSKLKERISFFEGETVQVKCTIKEGGSVECEALDPKVLNKVQSDLVSKLKQIVQRKVENKERSEVFGNIQVLNPDTKGNIQNMLQVSVPIVAPDFTSESVSSTFLVIGLNLVKYQNKTRWIAFWAATSFGSMTVLLAFVWGSTIRKKKEYELAFQRVATVMNSSPTPYVKLDAKDQICDCNASFLKKLGWSEFPQSFEKLKEFKFRSLCADDESERIYDTVEANRAKGKAVPPYALKLRRFDGSSVSVKVVSAAVPSSVQKETMPETFGILLDDM
jgi:PAS domain-containing protein